MERVFEIAWWAFGNPGRIACYVFYRSQLSSAIYRSSFVHASIKSMVYRMIFEGWREHQRTMENESLKFANG